MSGIAERWRRVVDRVGEAAVRCGRSPDDVRVCAVTKTVGPPEIREAVAAGAKRLGESRVQAAEPKIRELAAEGLAVEWHMIGRLQRNKARRAVELFDAVQSVDSLPLASRLSALGVERGRPVAVLIEVLTSAEETKGGVSLAEAPEVIAAARELPGIAVGGLMTMAPFTADEVAIRTSFASLRELRERLGGAAALPALSMGMTNDFEIAVEEGSTLVRVGTAIFGP